MNDDTSGGWSIERDLEKAHKKSQPVKGRLFEMTSTESLAAVEELSQHVVGRCRGITMAELGNGRKFSVRLFLLLFLSILIDDFF